MKKVILCAMLLAVPASALPKRNFPIYILFAAFYSKDAGPVQKTIGKRTSTVLGLQVWQTLRRAPTPNPQNLNFGVGGVTWDFDSPPPKDFTEAEALVQKQEGDNQLVLWGRASQYAEGFIIEPYLSVCNTGTGATLGKDIWQAALGKDGRKNGRTTVVSVDIPEWHYEFSPVVIRGDFQPGVNDPTDIEIYDQPDGKVVGQLVDDFVAMERQSDYAKVRLKPSKKQVWIHLPKLPSMSAPDKPNEVVSFCGGLIRLFREDWQGALDMFTEVVSNESSPTAIKIDAYLYMAIAASKLKKDDDSFVFLTLAYRLNPYYKMTTKYLCMSYLSQIANHPRAEGVQSNIASLRQLLNQNRALFANNDPWIAQVQKVIASAAPQQ